MLAQADFNSVLQHLPFLEETVSDMEINCGNVLLYIDSAKIERTYSISHGDYYTPAFSDTKDCCLEELKFAVLDKEMEEITLSAEQRNLIEKQIEKQMQW